MAGQQDSGCGTLIALSIGALILWQCSHHEDAADAPRQPQALDFSERSYAPRDYRSFSSQADPDEIRADAMSDLAGSSYQAEGSPYGCSDDCSGHEAGWAWAADHEISDAGDCHGNSTSFEEGCQAFAEAVEQRVEDEQ